MRNDGSAPARAWLAAGLLCSFACNGAAPGDGVSAAQAPSPPGSASGTPTTSPTTPPSGGHSPIPIDAVYGVQIQGRAGPLSGYAPFDLAAEVHLSPTIAPTIPTTNGSNPIDVAIFTSPAVPLGTHGALSFGTNTSLAAVRGGAPASAVDIAFVTLSVGGSHLEAVVDGSALSFPGGRPGAFNVYGVASGAIDEVVAGTVTVRLDGSGSMSGTIQLGGSSGSQYSATFSGSRTR